MVDRWLATLTQRQLILLLVVSWLCIGIVVSAIMFIAGYGWLFALMFGVGSITILAIIGVIRLVVKVVLKIRRG